MKIPTITNYRKKQIRKNLQTIFNTTTEEERNQGRTWYKTANRLAKEIQKETGNIYTLDQVAGIISALSPLNKWEQNEIDALNVAKAHKNGIDPDSMKVNTTHLFKHKAFNIAKGIEQIKSNARKTFSFMHNILLDPTKVTIDRWHLRACFGPKVEGTPGKKVYDIIEEITIQEAEKVGLKGYEFQAIIWEKIRTA